MTDSKGFDDRSSSSMKDCSFGIARIYIKRKIIVIDRNNGGKIGIMIGDKIGPDVDERETKICLCIRGKTRKISRFEEIRVFTG